VAAAVSVLAGALLVGYSVRQSLRDIAVSGLGRTEHAISSLGFFRSAFAEDLARALPQATAAPLLVASGMVTSEKSGRRAADVVVYGVDERFWSFQGQSNRPGVLLSPALMSELGTSRADTILLRLQKPSAIPIESLFGRKDDIGRTIRLTVDEVLPSDELGEFSLKPRQSEVRAVFLPLSSVQRDLGVADRVNTIVVAGSETSSLAETLRRVVRLEDLGATVAITSSPESLVVESASGILSASLQAASVDAGRSIGLTAVPVFTYLANTIRDGDRQIPYSLVSAIDLTQVGSNPSSFPADAIVFNEWAARELGAKLGDPITLDYFLWDAANGLTTHSAQFKLARVVSIEGVTADRRLAPEYPGITAANSLSDWDPPFPVDLSRVRPQDEAYWKQFRTTPKAFISFEQGRELWRTRYGAATSVRFPIPAGSAATEAASRFRDAIRPLLNPQALGLTISPVRANALAASSGATDFGEYFTYFSFFIVVSALLLTVLFFRLGIEQRLRQIGILRASGFTVGQLRTLLIAECLVLAAAGSIIGMVDALGYGWLMIHGLRTWWVGAVGTTRLALHVSWGALLIGAAGGLVAAVVCVMVSLRAVARLSPRALLNAQVIDTDLSIGMPSKRIETVKWIGVAVGVAMLVTGFAGLATRAAMFFGAGTALLIAAMCQFSSSLRRRDSSVISGRGAAGLWRFGFRSASFRPSRSVLSAALIAAAAFIIVSVDAFRHGDAFSTDTHSGTGGFALLAKSEVPIVANPNDAAGREALVVNSPDFTRIRFTRFRLRPGEDVSCLNLFRPSTPTLIAAEPRFIESGRFSFSASLAASEAERANPWLLLRRPATDAVPVVADATSLEYVLHASVGDTVSIDIGGDRPLVLQYVGAVRDSVLQGELVISEENFTRLFPTIQGYRWFLIDDPAVRSRAQADGLAGTLERELAPYGFDAVSTAEQLDAFHRVENTYLSTFQMLGGLGLLLGTIGLAAIMFRNVLERRRELALLRAVGYDARRISIVIIAEVAVLVGVGLFAGVACAAVAISPAWLERQHTAPGAGLIVLLALVAAAGLLSSIVAVRAATHGRILDALSAE